MTPNINVYGAESTWIHVLPPSAFHADNKNLVPAWQTIAGGISAGKIDYSQPLDNSICYTAIAEDAPAAGVYFAAGNDLEHPTENKPYKENFFISAGDYQYGLFTTIPYYDITDNFPQKYTYAIGSSPVSNNPNMGIKPLCSSSLKDLVLCIYVVGANSDYTDFKNSTYNGYKQQYSASHPNIIAVYGVPYARLEGSSNRSALTNSESYNFSGFARMGEYEIPNRGEKIIDYSASIAHESGLVFHLWGIPKTSGSEYYGNSPNYIYRAIGSGGSFIAANGNIFYSRSWGAAYQEHSGDDWIRKVAASYGVFFADRTSYASSAAYASANMYLGTIGEDGLCHGEYTTGSDNTSQPQYIWESTNESSFDPSKEYDETKYDYITHFNSQASVGSCNKRYVITEAVLNKCVKELATALTTYTEPSMSDSSIKAFLTNNPMDCIISVKKFPVNLTVLSEVPLKFGAYTSQDPDIKGGELVHSWERYQFIFSEANRNNIYNAFGDSFLDYEPYTRAELIIPYCGTVPLSLADFRNHNIRVDLYIDFITGACTAYVLRDNLALISISGQASVDVAISGVQQATLDSQITNANIQYKAAQLNAQQTLVSTFTHSLTNGLSGNVAKTANQGISDYYNIQKADLYKDQAEYENNHVQVPFKQLSASTGVLSLAYEQRCRLVIYRPKLDPNYDPAQYGHTVGFACLINDTLEHHSGFAQVSDIDLSGIPCTAEEKSMIMRSLLGGVYI